MAVESSINRIMADVELFLQIHQITPPNRGVIMRNQLFLHSASIFKNKPAILAKYLQIKHLAERFPAFLNAWVKQVDFLSKWETLSKEEKRYILFFDVTSYSILRQVLPVEKIYQMNLNNIIHSLDLRLTPKLMTKLGLPSQFTFVPYNSVQMIGLAKSLASMGYSVEDINEFMRNIDIDNYAKKLVALICKNKSLQEVEELLEDTPFHIDYTTAYFLDEELKFKATYPFDPV